MTTMAVALDRNLFLAYYSLLLDLFWTDLIFITLCRQPFKVFKGSQIIVILFLYEVSSCGCGGRRPDLREHKVTFSDINESV